MEAEGRKLVWCDVAQYVAGLSALDQEVSELVADLLLRMRAFVVPLKEGDDVRFVLASGLTGDDAGKYSYMVARTVPVSFGDPRHGEGPRWPRARLRFGGSSGAPPRRCASIVLSYIFRHAASVGSSQYT